MSTLKVNKFTGTVNATKGIKTGGGKLLIDFTVDSSGGLPDSAGAGGTAEAGDWFWDSGNSQLKFYVDDSNGWFDLNLTDSSGAGPSPFAGFTGPLQPETANIPAGDSLAYCYPGNGFNQAIGARPYCSGETQFFTTTGPLIGGWFVHTGGYSTSPGATPVPQNGYLYMNFPPGNTDGPFYNTASTSGSLDQSAGEVGTSNIYDSADVQINTVTNTPGDWNYVHYNGYSHAASWPAHMSFGLTQGSTSNGFSLSPNTAQFQRVTKIETTFSDTAELGDNGNSSYEFRRGDWLATWWVRQNDMTLSHATYESALTRVQSDASKAIHRVDLYQLYYKKL